MSSKSRRRVGEGGVIAQYHPSRLPGLHCSTLIDDGQLRVHVHDRLVLLTLTDGEALVRCGGETHALTPGSLLMIEPGDVHRDIQKTPYRAVMVELHTDLANTLRGPGDGPWLASSLARCVTLCTEMMALVEAVRAQRELVVQERQTARLFQLLAPFGARSTPRPEPPLVARTRRVLKESPFAKLSLDELAGRLRCSPSYLCRVFSEHIGVGPRAYQLQLRLLEARRLIESGQTVATVAQLTGFGDASHLRRHFLRRFALAPGRYRKELASIDKTRPASARQTSLHSPL